ncbi:hypothetical protein VMCG_08811 [Cytospora schulzeri]|uniref:Uncharacterized protein n=1 Tax=Cytospora schulzeri TaxID=448051 RepID=A0A423VSD8_9PEZI|nr:hypothetical protein VMCG_08811 [Valsa malicola]
MALVWKSELGRTPTVRRVPMGSQEAMDDKATISLVSWPDMRAVEIAHGNWCDVADHGAGIKKS